jgi:hypothetical protein
MEKLRIRKIVATAALTAVTVSFLLLKEKAVDREVASEPAPKELAVLYLPEDPISTSAMPQAEPPPAPLPLVRADPSDSPPDDGEQRIFQSRKALETMDPREYLRHR